MQFGINQHQQIFQRLTKLHEPVGWVQSVFFKKFTDGLLLQSITKRDGLLPSTTTSVALGKCVYFAVKTCLREHFYTWVRLADFGKIALTKEITVAYVNACQWTLPIWCFLCKLWKKNFSTGHMIAISFFPAVNMQFSTSQNTDSYLTNATVLLRLKRFFFLLRLRISIVFFLKKLKTFP